MYSSLVGSFVLSEDNEVGYELPHFSLEIINDNGASEIRARVKITPQARYGEREREREREREGGGWGVEREGLRTPTTKLSR